MSDIRNQVDRSDLHAANTLQAARKAVATAGASPVDVQVCFLESLLSQPKEAKKFLDQPQSYAAAHGVVLDPDLLRDIVAVVAFGEPVARLAGRISEGAMRDIAGFRDRPNAAVLQGAAAVCTMTSNATGTPKPGTDTSALTTPTGVQGVRLPGGRTLQLPKDIHANVLVVNNAVAVYGATTMSSLSAITGRNKLGGTRR
jgi:hypothetical protein